jgi:hypothetical protein
MHDAELMGWKAGDRIAIAPTQRIATADAQTFFIKSINKTMLFLAADDTLKFDGILNQVRQYNNYNNSQFHLQQSSGIFGRRDNLHAS